MKLAFPSAKKTEQKHQAAKSNKCYIIGEDV